MKVVFRNAFSFRSYLLLKEVPKWPFLRFSRLWRAINSSENKNSKIHSERFFCISKSYLHAKFQVIWSRNEKALGFLRSFFCKSWSKPCIFVRFYLNFCSNGRPSNAYKIWTDDNQETNEHFLKPRKIGLNICKHKEKKLRVEILPPLPS